MEKKLTISHSSWGILEYSPMHERLEKLNGHFLK